MEDDDPTSHHHVAIDNDDDVEDDEDELGGTTTPTDEDDGMVLAAQAAADAMSESDQVGVAEEDRGDEELANSGTSVASREVGGDEGGFSTTNISTNDRATSAATSEGAEIGVSAGTNTDADDLLHSSAALAAAPPPPPLAVAPHLQSELQHHHLSESSLQDDTDGVADSGAHHGTHPQELDGEVVAEEEGEEEEEEEDEQQPQPIRCRICGRGEEEGRPLLRFLPVDHDIAAATAAPGVVTFTDDISLHIFCGKTASILPTVNQPDLEILTKAGLKNKHGIGPEVNAALARTRCAILAQEGSKEKHFYLVREFEAHLAAIRHTHITFPHDNSGGQQTMVMPAPPPAHSGVVPPQTLPAQSNDLFATTHLDLHHAVPSLHHHHHLVGAPPPHHHNPYAPPPSAHYLHHHHPPSHLNLTHTGLYDGSMPLLPPPTSASPASATTNGTTSSTAAPGATAGTSATDLHQASAHASQLAAFATGDPMVTTATGAGTTGQANSHALFSTHSLDAAHLSAYSPVAFLGNDATGSGLSLDPATAAATASTIDAVSLLGPSASSTTAAGTTANSGEAGAASNNRFVASMYSFLQDTGLTTTAADSSGNTGTTTRIRTNDATSGKTIPVKAGHVQVKHERPTVRATASTEADETDALHLLEQDQSSSTLHEFGDNSNGNKQQQSQHSGVGMSLINGEEDVMGGEDDVAVYHHHASQFDDQQVGQAKADSDISKCKPVEGDHDEEEEEGDDDDNTEGKIRCGCGGSHLPTGTPRGLQSWKNHVTTKRHQKWMEENGMLGAV